MTQARLLWLFARLARGPYGRPEHLRAADWGCGFLLDAFWDAEHGGFYWEVDESGGRPLRDGKHLYGQAFALLALCEYALAGGDAVALARAGQCYDLIEERGHDPVHGGYLESLDRDWRPLPPGGLSYLGLDTGIKTMNTHMHLLEAVAAYLRTRPSPAARQRLMELIQIQSATVLRAETRASADRFTRDWRLAHPERDPVSYGHDLENIWLLLDACHAAGISPSPLLPRLRAVFAHSLAHGYDRRRGGFFEHGPPERRATGRDKIWWVQAEAIVCCLCLHRLTGDPLYLSVFMGTYDFIERHQVDWVHGEWHGRITPCGPAAEDKAHLGKTGFHNGRAMLECLALLEAMRR